MYRQVPQPELQRQPSATQTPTSHHPLALTTPSTVVVDNLPPNYPSGHSFPNIPPGDLGNELYFKTLFFNNKPPITPCWVLRVLKYGFTEWKAAPTSGFRYCLGAVSTKSGVSKSDVECMLSWMAVGPQPLLYIGTVNGEIWASPTPWAVDLMTLTSGNRQVTARDGRSMSFSRRVLPANFTQVLKISTAVYVCVCVCVCKTQFSVFRYLTCFIFSPLHHRTPMTTMWRVQGWKLNGKVMASSTQMTWLQ